MSAFARSIASWQSRHGRHDLPWQGTLDPYRIWLSEIMLQQTQVATVITYFVRFTERLPDLHHLAAASQDEVLQLWSGLGYYSRARNLHRAARLVIERHAGVFPCGITEIEALPGIGRSTAAAISALAFGARAAILDGNVKRVLARHFAVEGFPGARAVELALWRLAETLLPEHDHARYVQGLMDLGATVCTPRAPACARCPVRNTCRAYSEARVAELPAARPRRLLRTRATTMLVLLEGGRVLLRKRPATGVWGGLWSLPEIEAAADARRLAALDYGCEVRDVTALRPLKHAFTHFTLVITPLIAQVRPALPRAAQPGHMWLPLAQALDAALPAPVRKILASLVPSTAGEQATLFEVAVQDL